MAGVAQPGDEPKYLADAGVGNRQPGPERSGDKPGGLTLNQIRLVYVDPFVGDVVGNELLRSRLSAVLGTSQTFATTRQRATADAVIKGNITSTENEVSVELRLVNAAGQVIWRRSARRMGNLDESVATSIAGALVEDLTRAAMEMKVKR